MSHNIEYVTYAENIHRDYVKRELDSYVAHADWQEGCSGLYRDIRWLDAKPVCDDEEAARAEINRLDRGNYDNLAVKFYAAEPIKDSKAYTALQEKARAALEAFRAKDNVRYAETVTAEYIGCKTCGSKLSRVHIKTNRCPLCGADLRPKTTRDAIYAAEAKWRKAQRAVEDYRKQHAQKKVMWLVKIEYHT